MQTTILVLANQTVPSDELLATLKARSSRGAIVVELVVPPAGAGTARREEAEQRLEQALGRLHAAGIEATGALGDSDALSAVVEAYDRSRHDEIIVSTLPPSISHWLGIDLPARVAAATNALVTHVSVAEPRPARRA